MLFSDAVVYCGYGLWNSRQVRTRMAWLIQILVSYFINYCDIEQRGQVTARPGLYFILFTSPSTPHHHHYHYGPLITTYYHWDMVILL